MIAELIRRDAPSYSGEIPAAAVEGMNRFAAEMGLLSRAVGYGEVAHPAC